MGFRHSLRDHGDDAVMKAMLCACIAVGALLTKVLPTAIASGVSGLCSSGPSRRRRSSRAILSVASAAVIGLVTAAAVAALV